MSSFVEDLNKYSADKIVEMYGTHVLTNITVGGKYTAYYKSAIIEENSSTEKTEIVSAGAKYNLSNIGLDAHGSWSKTEVEERNKKILIGNAILRLLVVLPRVLLLRSHPSKDQVLVLIWEHGQSRLMICILDYLMSTGMLRILFMI